MTSAAEAKPISLSDEADAELQPYSPLRDTMRRLWSSPSARLGGFIVVVFVTISIAVPLLDDYDAVRDRNLPARYAEPDCFIGWLNSQFSDNVERQSLGSVTCEYPFGADKNGRSIFRRVGHGMSVSLMAGVVAVTIAMTSGTEIGLCAGYFAGWIDSVSMRLMDVILAFPSLLLAIAIVTVTLDPSNPSAENGLRNAMIAVAVTQIPIYARLARSMAISARSMEYVVAAQSVGARDLTIIRRHVFPNSLAPLIVQGTLGLGTAVVETAALGFLGLGQQPPYPELGKMLADSQQVLLSGKWWVMLFPGVTIILMVLGFNLLGDGLRDALDPRLRGDR
jgi:peptide/nickel transport system permease protein